MNRLWKCPRCARPAIRAPSRLRKVDARLYCLPCTEETGKLVVRVCEASVRAKALVKARDKMAKAALRDANASQREVDRATRAVRAEAHKAATVLKYGVDWAEQRKIVWRAICKGEGLGRKPMPALRVKKKHRGLLGEADYDSHRVTLTTHHVETPERMAAVLLHELAHITQGPQSREDGRRKHHGPDFSCLLARCARHAWGIEISTLGVHKRETRHWREIELEITEALKTRGTYTPVPAPTKEE